LWYGTILSYPFIYVHPNVALKPTMPQTEDWIPTKPVPHKSNIYEYKPTPSAPIVTEYSPYDTSAARPDEEPQVYLSTQCGFLVVLQNKMVKTWR
jgi:hypothetical protein